MVKVKICGLMDIAAALAAARAGADYLGMVFAPGRRQVSFAQAKEISLAVRALTPRPRLVGVFAAMPAGEVNRALEYCLLDCAQLAGGEGWDYCREIRPPFIKSIHISPRTTAGGVLAGIEKGYRFYSRKDLTFLLDTAFEGKSGGTGRVFDWEAAKENAAQFDIIVAGGLNPANVTQLLEEVHPWGVDVSTGVETEGHKDPVKIAEFISKVRSFEQNCITKKEL